MWIYSISEGKLTRDADITDQVCSFIRCYSGHGEGVNNLEMCAVPDVGPIPPGSYTIGPFFDDREKGPVVAHLIPDIGTKTFGRNGFMIHGDNQQMNHSASLGCIIAPRVVREAVRDSGDKLLEVIG